MQPEQICHFSEAGEYQRRESVKQWKTTLISSNYYNGYLYYFTCCSAKASNHTDEYKKGYFVFCYDPKQDSFSFFFKSTDQKYQFNIKKMDSLRSKALKMNAIKKELQLQEKRIVITHFDEKMKQVKLNLKFQEKRIAEQCRQLFAFYSNMEKEKVNRESSTYEKQEEGLGLCLRRNKTETLREEQNNNIMNGSTKKIIYRNSIQPEKQVNNLSQTKKRVIDCKKDQQQQTDFVQIKTEEQNENRQKQFKQRYKMMQYKLKEMDQQSKKTSILYEISKSTIANLQQTKERLRQKILQLQRRLLNSQQQIQALKGRLKASQQIILSCQSRQKQLQAKYHVSILEKEQFSQKLEKSKQQILLQSKNYSIILTQVEQLSLLNIFYGDILEQQFTHKKYLKRCIEEFTRMKITQTKPVYRWDPLNKTNFHRYIDNRPNLLLIAKTVNGYIFAGFSESSIRPVGATQDRGFIASLTSEQVYQCLPGNKSVTYDDYYIIFGNSQIRIKSQQSLIFSNFGISNSFYDTSGRKIEKLLGVAAREAELQSYEIYQVFLQ